MPFLARTDRWISKLASRLYRGEPVASSRHDGWLKAAYLAGMCTGIAFLAIFFSHEWDLWRNAIPGFVVERTEWRVKTLAEKLGCFRSECPTDLARQEFWNTSVSLTDPGAKTILREGHAKEVWLGLRVSQNLALEAAATHSNLFVLGWLKGSYTIWINGKILQEVAEDEMTPQVISVPISELEAGTDLSFVVRLRPRLDGRNVVPFTAGMKEGFANQRTAHAFNSYHKFASAMKPLAIFLVFLVFSAIFFFLWVASPKNREYLHLSAFALVCGLPSILYSDGFSYRFSYGTGIRLYITLVVAKAALGLNLGLSFSRARPRLIAWVTGLAAFCVVVLVVFFSATELASFRRPLNQFLVSAAYFAGALICFVQARALLLRERSGFSVRLRLRKLVTFASILLILALIQYQQYGPSPTTYLVDVFWDMPELVLALFLGAIALSDYRTQYEMMERTPVSSYHRRGDLPESLAGVVMMLDLKNSETIFRACVSGPDQFLVPNIISSIWAAIAEKGGIVIKAEGDEVMAFFDLGNNPQPLESALLASDLCQTKLEQISSQIMGAVGKRLEFRAGLAFGTIRPIWIGEGKERLPGWTQVSDSMVFVDCARLLEIEKTVSLQKGIEGSLVVLNHDLLQRFPWEGASFGGEIVFSGERARGKHDRIYSISGYRPRRQGKRLRRVG